MRRPTLDDIAGKRWLTTAEAALWAGLGVTNVRAMADAGRFRTRRTPGGHRRIERESIDAVDMGEVVALEILRGLR